MPRLNLGTVENRLNFYNTNIGQALGKTPKTTEEFQNVLDNIDCEIACSRHKKAMVKVWKKLAMVEKQNCGYLTTSEHRFKFNMERWFTMHGANLKPFESDAAMAFVATPASEIHANACVALDHIKKVKRVWKQDALKATVLKSTVAPIYKRKAFDDSVIDLKVEQLQTSTKRACIQDSNPHRTTPPHPREVDASPPQREVDASHPPPPPSSCGSTGAISRTKAVSSMGHARCLIFDAAL